MLAKEYKAILKTAKAIADFAGLPKGSVTVLDLPTLCIGTARISLSPSRGVREILRELTELAGTLTTQNPLLRLMQEQKLTYRDVSLETGIPRSLLHAYAHNKTSPSAARRQLFFNKLEIGHSAWPLPAREAHRPRKAA